MISEDAVLRYYFFGVLLILSWYYLNGLKIDLYFIAGFVLIMTWLGYKFNSMIRDNLK